MAKSAVVNASPLIYLAGGGCLSLLQLMAPTIVVPQSVHGEIAAHGSDDPVVQAVLAANWLVRMPDPPIPAEVQAWDLGPGESAVLSQALMRPGTEAILDDLAGRRRALSFQIPVRGTLGVVLTAKQRGAIPAARPVVEAMRRSGKYLSDRVLNEALSLVGE